MNLGFCPVEKLYVLLCPKHGAASIPQAWHASSGVEGDIALSQESLRGSGKRAWTPENIPESSGTASSSRAWLPGRTLASTCADSVYCLSVGSKPGRGMSVDGGVGVDKTPSSKMRKRLVDDCSEAAPTKIAKTWLPQVTPKSSNCLLVSQGRLRDWAALLLKLQLANCPLHQSFRRQRRVNLEFGLAACVKRA